MMSVARRLFSGARSFLVLLNTLSHSANIAGTSLISRQDVRLAARVARIAHFDVQKASRDTGILKEEWHNERRTRTMTILEKQCQDRAT